MSGPSAAAGRAQLQAEWPDGTRVYAPHGLGTIAWQSAAAQSLTESSQSIPVLLDRPPPFSLGGPMRMYWPHELQAVLV